MSPSVVDAKVFPVPGLPSSPQFSPPNSYKDTSSFPISQQREFNDRIATMHKFMCDKGLPNAHFPFVASFFTAYPDQQPRGELCNHFDLVAVLYGLRKVALVPLAVINESSMGQHLVGRIISRGGIVQQAINIHGEISDIAIGKPPSVHAVVETCAAFNRRQISLEQYHLQLGAALGYPREATERFIRKSGDPLEELKRQIIKLSPLVYPNGEGMVDLPMQPVVTFADGSFAVVV